MQGGYLSLLYSISNQPLEYWSKQKSRSGSIKRILDEELNENVLEIQDVDESCVQNTWIMCPPNIHQLLYIKLPIFVMVFKNRKIPCEFQIMIIDKNQTRHVLNFSTTEQKKVLGQRLTNQKIFVHLEIGWNILEIDLDNIAKSMKYEFLAVLRIKICANCRLRRIYFMDKHYDENEIASSLYQGFLDFYMMKWGIKEVERSTQTRKVLTVSKDVSVKSLPPSTNGKHFLRILQSKSDKLIEEFFPKSPIKSIKDFFDFKRRAKLKQYVILQNDKEKKNLNTNSVKPGKNDIVQMPTTSQATEQKEKDEQFKDLKKDTSKNESKYSKLKNENIGEKDKKTKLVEKVPHYHLYKFKPPV